jgi:hypothetical protein
VATWRVDLFDLNGSSALLSDIPIKDHKFKFSNRLSASGGFEAELIYDAAGVTEANFAPGRRELKVYRDASLVWGGYLWLVTAKRPRELKIIGEGWFSRLHRAFVVSDLIKTGVAQEQIVRDLIDHFQAQSGGNLGITTTLAGNHTGGSIARNRDYCANEAPNIGEALTSFTELDDGLDLELTAAKVLKTYQPRKGSASGVTLSRHTELNYEVDAGDVVSRVITLGDGECSPPRDDRTDSTALADYGLLMDVLGYESGHLADIQAHAGEALRNRKLPRWQATVTQHEDLAPAWASLPTIGDTLTLSSAYGFSTFSKTMRLIEFGVQVEDNDVAFYTYELDQVVA